MDGGDPAGGSAYLGELIDQYGDVLIPDLRHEYGLDLRDLFNPEAKLSPRYVLAHIKHLPMDSAFVAERRGGQQFRGWDESRYIAVANVNAIRTLQHLYVLAHSKKNAKPKPPEPYPIPDSKTKKDKPGSFAAIARRHLAAARRRKEGK